MNIVTTGLQEPDRLAPSTHEAIRLAQEEAVRMQARAVYPEHLLLGVIAQGENRAAKMMCRCGMDMQAIRVRASEVFGSQYVGTDNTDLPLSQESLQCIEWATKLVMRHVWAALVLPEHVVLFVLRHPHMRYFLAPFSSSVELIHGYLTKEMRTPLLRNIEDPLPTPAYMGGHQGVVNLSSERCPACKKEALPGWKHCAYCGASLARTCPNCGAAQPEVEDAQYCFECGSPLEQKFKPVPGRAIEKREKLETKTGFTKGQRVRVLDGPFTEYIGTVVDIDTERSKVTVLVSFFGRETPVVLDFLQVEKI
jgi:Double zinc ribbon/Clp amino terminal domain, pathogenicity island component/KOW motif